MSKTEFYRLLRAAITGKPDGIGVVDAMMLLGKDETLERLRLAIEWLA